MLSRIDQVLSEDELARIRAVFDEVACVPGSQTASGPAAEAKHNLQLPHDRPEVQGIMQLVLDALARSREFFATAYPRRAYPPLLSRYEDGMSYGEHVDNSVMHGGAGAVRTDVAVTLFLSDPASYDGGELVIRMTGGETAVKLPAGSLVAYPPHFLHRVAPVTRGVRLAAVTWIESMLRHGEQRTVMGQLDRALAQLGARGDAAEEFAAVNNAYHTLMRLWVSP